MIPYYQRTFVLVGSTYKKDLKIIRDPNEGGLAVEYTDRGNVRFLPMHMAGKIFIITNANSGNEHIEDDYTIGALPSGYFIKIKKSGLYARRTELREPTPWVFFGTAGYGYGI